MAELEPQPSGTLEMPEEPIRKPMPSGPPVSPEANPKRTVIPKDLSIEEDMINWVIDNPKHEDAVPVVKKLKVSGEDLEMWKWARDNPMHEDSLPIRNKVMDNMADRKPAEDVQGVNLKQRLAIKTLIANDPKIQQEYLERQGFQTRINKEDGTVEVKKEGEANFSVIDPSDFEFLDVLDIAGDVVEAALVGIAAGSGAAFGGGVGGVPAAAAAGGLAELAKQNIAQLAGVREDKDLADIGLNAAISAAPSAVLKGFGSLAKGAGEAYSNVIAKLKKIPLFDVGLDVADLLTKFNTLGILSGPSRFGKIAITAGKLAQSGTATGAAQLGAGQAAESIQSEKRGLRIPGSK